MMNQQDALATFYSCCEAERSRKEFPWRKLLYFGYAAGFERKIKLTSVGSDYQMERTFYAETLIRCMMSFHPPIEKETELFIRSGGDRWVKFAFLNHSGFYRMFEAFYNRRLVGA